MSKPTDTARDRLAAEQARQRSKERRLMGLIALVVVVLLVGGGLGYQTWRTSRSPNLAGAAASPAVAFAPVTIAAGQPITLGAANAPRTVTLYEDFHCPHCADFEEELGPVVTDAQNSGAVKVELYPMAFIDEGSSAASNALACAAEEGIGQAYYAGLFANHTLTWSSSQLVELGTLIDPGVSEQFTTCVTTNVHADWVTSINTTAAANGVTGTPTLFVDGQSVDVNGLTADALRAQLAAPATGAVSAVRARPV